MPERNITHISICIYKHYSYIYANIRKDIMSIIMMYMHICINISYYMVNISFNHTSYVNEQLKMELSYHHIGNQFIYFISFYIQDSLNNLIYVRPIFK